MHVGLWPNIMALLVSEGRRRGSVAQTYIVDLPHQRQLGANKSPRCGTDSSLDARCHQTKHAYPTSNQKYYKTRHLSGINCAGKARVWVAANRRSAKRPSHGIRRDGRSGRERLVHGFGTNADAVLQGLRYVQRQVLTQDERLRSGQMLTSTGAGRVRAQHRDAPSSS